MHFVYPLTATYLGYEDIELGDFFSEYRYCSPLRVTRSDVVYEGSKHIVRFRAVLPNGPTGYTYHKIPSNTQTLEELLFYFNSLEGYKLKHRIDFADGGHTEIIYYSEGVHIHTCDKDGKSIRNPWGKDHPFFSDEFEGDVVFSDSIVYQGFTNEIYKNAKGADSTSSNSVKNGTDEKESVSFAEFKKMIRTDEMRKLPISRFAGITVDMNYLLCVPSVHATYKDAQIVVDFDCGIRRVSGEFPDEKKELLLKWVSLHKKEIQGNHLLINRENKPPMMIPPLEISDK